MKLIWQVEDTEQRFRHRLRNEYDDPAAADLPHAPWAGYSSPAINYTTKGRFVVVTDGLTDDVFPEAGKIYWVREAPESI